VGRCSGYEQLGGSQCWDSAVRMRGFAVIRQHGAYEDGFTVLWRRDAYKGGFAVLGRRGAYKGAHIARTVWCVAYEGGFAVRSAGTV